MKKGTRTFWTVVALLLVAEVATVLVVRHWYDLFPPRDVGVIYKHYEHSDHIDATFVKGFRINDSMKVDITILEATDSVGWERLKEDFDIIEAEDLLPDERDIFNAIYGNSISMKRAIPGKYYQKPDTNLWNDDVVAIERAEKRVTVFHTANITNSVDISGYLLEQMTSTNKLNIQNKKETN